MLNTKRCNNNIEDKLNRCPDCNPCECKLTTGNKTRGQELSDNRWSYCRMVEGGKEYLVAMQGKGVKRMRT